MYISYEYYRIFYHVARCGNLTKAAEALQNSQPNLTRAIRNLEAEIGCPLFSRTNRGMILTPEGEGLYRHIKIACTEIEAGEAAVTQSRTLERGNVFLAASEGALRCLLLPVLKRYQEKYPGVHLRISNHSTPQAVAALHETTADFAVITTPVTLSPSLTPRRALFFNPPSKPPRLTRSSQWQKRVLASASCRRRSFVRLIMCAASNCKSPSRCVPCAS